MTSAGEFVHTETEYQSVKPISQCYLRPSDAKIQGIAHKLHFFLLQIGLALAPGAAAAEEETKQCDFPHVHPISLCHVVRHVHCD